MRRPAAFLIAACVFAVRIGPAHAQRESPVFEERQPIPANVSTDLIDPDGHSRFHLVTRASFGDGHGKVFSNSSIWSFEGRGHVRLADGLALAFVVPFGLYAPNAGPNKFFFGNLSAGIAGGGRILLGESSGAEAHPILRLGAGLDVYAPTAPKPPATDPILLGTEIAVALMRAYEPYLYASNMMAFRARLHGDLSISLFRAELELGLVPGFTLGSSTEFLMWLSVGGRVSVRPANEIDLFLEMGSAIQIAGPFPKPPVNGDLSPPFLVTPGARFHVLGLDPAVFVSFNFKEAASLIFGVDLAGVFQTTRTDLRNRDSDDFLKGF